MCSMPEKIEEALRASDEQLTRRKIEAISALLSHELRLFRSVRDTWRSAEENKRESVWCCVHMFHNKSSVYRR